MDMEYEYVLDSLKYCDFFGNAKKENFSGTNYPFKILCGRLDYIAPISTAERFFELVENKNVCELVVSENGNHSFKDSETKEKVLYCLSYLMDNYKKKNLS